jgi:predicted RNA-binding protein with PUA-like domain
MSKLWAFLADPEDFGWNELEKAGSAVWDGIKNARAQNYLRTAGKGDRALVYHTAPDKAIVGVAKVVSAPRPDPKAPERVVVDVEPLKKLKQPVTLAELKADRLLAEMSFVRMPRVAVQPVTEKEWARVLELSGTRIAGFLLALLFSVSVVGHAQVKSSAPAFVVEAAGGIAGSFTGFGLVYALGDRCAGEDLACEIRTAGGAIAAGTVVSALGTYWAGKAFDTNPSGLGAALGSIAGAAAGIGAWHLMTEELDVVKSDAGAIITYGVVQGLMSALGSRVVRALK